MNSSNSRRTSDTAQTVANMISSIAELTKRTNNFEELRDMLPLVADLKKADTNNKQMNQILRVMHEAIPKLKSTYGSTSRSGETFSNMLDRMMGQLQTQYVKLQQNLKGFQGKQTLRENQDQEQLEQEVNILVKDIQNAMATSKKKLKDFIQKQKTDLCLQQSNVQQNKYQLSLLKEKLLKDNKINTNIQECKSVLGSIRCYLQFMNCNDKGVQQQRSFASQIESFIKQCQLHFDRQYKQIVDKLKAFQQIKKFTNYQQKMFYQYYSMGNRLKIRLQSAIIKLSLSINQFVQTEKPIQQISRWKQVIGQWQLMLKVLRQVLQ